MKRFSRILFYLRSQKRNIALYFVFNILSILFSLVSMALLAPFLQILFGTAEMVTVKPKWEATGVGVLNYMKYLMSTTIEDHGPIYVLGGYINV